MPAGWQYEIWGLNYVGLNQKAVSQGTTLGVLRATPGQLVFGVPGMRPTFVTLADFTDPYYPDGFANYYVGNYGVMGEKTPLVGPLSPWANVGKKQ